MKTIIGDQASKVKCLRTENSLEFCNEVFTSFCRKNGITRHMIVPKNPLQNGLGERMNKILLERVRCMLSDASILNIFWGKVGSMAKYFINRYPLMSEEVWFGKPIKYDHLLVFGYVSYIQVRQEK